MKVGSLFSGIGGLDLGLERAGMEVVWQVEINEYCNRVLEKHWSNVRRYRDVRECGKHNLERVDLICGGFPCQPVSNAGKRKGAKDERWLWTDFYRIICEIRPRWALIENVPGLLSIDTGRLFAGILRDLYKAGYDAEWFTLRASDVGAPHRRERIFIVAHTNNERHATKFRSTNTCGSCSEETSTESRYASPVVPNTNRHSLWFKHGRGSGACGQSTPESQHDGEKELFPHSNDPPSTRQRKHSGQGIQEPETIRFGKSGLCPDSVISRLEIGNGSKCERPKDSATINRCDWWATEPDVGRVAHGVPSRVDRLKGLGNAVVPQVAEYIGHAIIDYESKSE